jgi:hypothetical protein
MTTLAPTATFTPNPDYVAKTTSDKDEKLAIDVAQVVAPIFQLLYTAPITDPASAMAAGLAFAAMNEVVWRWTYSDVWPLPAETVPETP